MNVVALVIVVVVSALAVAAMLVVRRRGIGGLRPVAMERALDIIDQELTVAGFDRPIPCDNKGERIETS
jgi:hypothetical protein